MSPRIYSEGQIELDYTKNGLGRILGRFAFWIATGHADMRRGMQSLALTVQESFEARSSLMCRLWICSGSGLKARYCALILSAVAT
jgi:hypothetical protein